jgi:hypothetical protein
LQAAISISDFGGTKTPSSFQEDIKTSRGASGGDMTSRVLPDIIKTSSKINTSCNAFAEAPPLIYHLRPEALAKFLVIIMATPLLRPEALAKFSDTILAAPILISEPTILGGMTTSQVQLVAETPLIYHLRPEALAKFLGIIMATPLLISHLMPDELAEILTTMAAAPPLILHLRPKALAKFSRPTSVMIPPHFLHIRIPTTLITFGLLQLHF